jgi:hypothetical protein
METPIPTMGLLIYRNLDLDETGVSIKGGAGVLYGYYLSNNATSVRYVKLYNKATAATVGTDTPVMTLAIPALSAANVSFPFGVEFATGLSAGCVTAVADNSTAAPSANDVVANFFYK